MNPLFIRNFGQDYVQNLRTLAQSIADVLRFYGCKRIYGVGGDYAASLIKSLEERIDLLPCSNEMHAGFTACSQAEIAGLGVCLTTYMVGSFPTLAAAALAKAEKLPVIFISGAPAENEITDTLIHHMACPHDAWKMDYDSALKAFTGLGIRAERLQGLRNPYQPSIANEQFFNLVTHAYLNKEPVFIEIPRDLPTSFVQAMSLPKNKDEILVRRNILSGSEAIAQHITSQLNQSQKPLLYFGERIKSNSQLIQTLFSFCEKHRIPYASSLFSKSLIREDHELSIGMYNGVFSTQRVRNYIENHVDYILEVGTSILDQDTSTAFGTETHRVDTFENKTVLKGTCPLISDILEVFLNIEKHKIKTMEWDPRLLCDAEETQSRLSSQELLTFSNLTQVLNDIQEKIKHSLIYLPEIGNSFFASFNLKTKQSDLNRSWITNPWYAAMGTSLSYARAVCHVLKDQKSSNIPVVITGDGGFHFQCNELIQFMREKLFVVIILMNNQIFHLGKNSNAQIYQSSSADLNLEYLVKAYGGFYSRCTSVGLFESAMNEAISTQQGIHFLEVPTSTDEKDLSAEIQILNLYIQTKIGSPDSIEKWKRLL